MLYGNASLVIHGNHGNGSQVFYVLAGALMAVWEDDVVLENVKQPAIEDLRRIDLLLRQGHVIENLVHISTSSS
jgi:hypothetical protein